MRIVERYGTGFKLFRGEGVWALFDPCKSVLSMIYRLWLHVSTGRRKGNARTARIAPLSARDARPLVVSIGNIEVGGGGKTPCTLRLAEEIRMRDGIPVVVSRGYQGVARRYAPCVVPGGLTIGTADDIPYTTEAEVLSRAGSSQKAAASMAALLGDEIMLYRSRGIPVVIDANRGRAAQSSFQRRIFCSMMHSRTIRS
jgi:tetraacyldisaccharide-1-P 4'-kinase